MYEVPEELPELPDDRTSYLYDIELPDELPDDVTSYLYELPDELPVTTY